MEGGMTLEKLKVVIEAYTKPYKDEMDKIRQKTATVTAQVERETTKMRNAYKKVAGTVAGVLSVAGIVSFSKSCIELGSDLQEVQNVVDVTFGDMNRQVDAFAKNAIHQYGLSELAAKEYMGTYGSMAKSFGFVTDEVYELSASITGLTGDLASFRNLTTDEAYTKLKSIFTGETESLKEIGVVMTQTALDQYALNEGLGKTTANMTEQEKVMLRYRFVMSSLSDASGDFARTSHSWANQVRVLQLQFESLKATIGQGLINALTPVIQVINTILARLQTLASYFKAFTTALFGDAGGGSALTDASEALGSAAGSSGAVADNMGSAAKAARDMKKSLASFDELNNLSSGSSSGGNGGGGSVDFGNLNGELFGETTVNPEIEEATDRIRIAVEQLREAAGPAREALHRLWEEGLTQLGTFSWTGLQDFWEYFLKPLGGWVLGEGFPRFVDITNEFLMEINWTEINDALREFWIALEPFAENVGEGLLWFYDVVLVPLATYTINHAVLMFLEALSELLEDLNTCIEYVKPAFTWFKETMSWFEQLSDSNPVIGEWVQRDSVDNLLESVEAFKVIKNFADTMDTWNGLKAWYEEQILPYLDEKEWTNLWYVIPFTMALMWEQYKAQWKLEIENWWSEQVTSWFTENKWETLFDTIYEQLMLVLKKTEAGWAIGIAKWWNENVEPWFTIAEWLELYNSIKVSMKTKWDETVGQWSSNVNSWWNSHVEPWFTVTKWKSVMSEIPKAFGDIFKDAVNAGTKQLNKLIDWVNEKLYFDFEGLEVMGEQIIPAFSVQLFTIPHIPTFASGGFPEAGQLFIANESGPELVGRIGNRTAVANAEQIVDAVARGVFMAVSGAGMGDEETMYRAFKRALEEVRPEAVMDSDRAFKAMQSKASEYRKRTGKPAFGY